MKKIIKTTLLMLVGLATIVGAWFVVNTYIYRSKAAVENVVFSFNPTTASLFEGDDLALSIYAQSSTTARVSGATVQVEYDKAKLQAPAPSAFSESNEACKKLETLVTYAVDTSGAKGVVRVTKVAIKTDAELPSGLFCFSTIKFKAIASGSAQIAFSQSLTDFDVSGPQPVTPQKDAAKSTVTTTIRPDTGTPILNFSVKLQGVSKKPSGAAKVPLKITATTSGGNFSKVFSNVEATADENGIWKGSLTMSGVEPGNNYRILIKGPKHLQRKYCHLTPTVEASGAYNCGTATITLRTGANTADFTALPILVGDLPVQDGLLNARDASVLRQNVFKTTDDALNVADLNYDGAANGTDYSLMIQSMQLKYDEED